MYTNFESQKLFVCHEAFSRFWILTLQCVQVRFFKLQPSAMWH